MIKRIVILQDESLVVREMTARPAARRATRSPASARGDAVGAPPAGAPTTPDELDESTPTTSRHGRRAGRDARPPARGWPTSRSRRR